MEEKKVSRKASVVFDDKVIETIYDPLLEKTQFVCYSKNDELEIVDKIEKNGEEIYPLDSRADIINKKVVLFPSEPVEYQSEEILIKEIQNFIHKYLEISPMFEKISSYYVLFSWIHDRFHEVPYLRAIGDYGSGKSRLLQTVGSICYRPIFTGGATTTAPIFRILNEINGTLVLDEADLRVSDMSTDIVKILNAGYQKSGNVLRMGGKEMQDLKAFDVFGPKIVATREKFGDKALESRFLVEEMGIGVLRNDIPRRLSDEFWNEAQALRNKLLMWRFRNYFKKLNFYEKPIEGIHPRLGQIISPLMTIIESEEMKNDLKVFINKYNDELIADRNLSREADIVFAILKIETDNNQKDITVGEIANFLNTETFDYEDRITAKKVGWYLSSKMQLKTERTRNGFVLNTNRNRKRIDFWKERFGIEDKDIDSEEVNIVNDVNNEEVLDVPTAEELGF
jgi:hypothetical protein